MLWRYQSARIYNSKSITQSISRWKSTSFSSSVITANLFTNQFKLNCWTNYGCVTAGYLSIVPRYRGRVGGCTHFPQLHLSTRTRLELKASMLQIVRHVKVRTKCTLSAPTTWEMWRSALAPNGDACKQNGGRHVLYCLTRRVISRGSGGWARSVDDCFNTFIVSYGYCSEEIRPHSEHCNFQR